MSTKIEKDEDVKQPCIYPKQTCAAYFLPAPEATLAQPDDLDYYRLMFTKDKETIEAQALQIEQLKKDGERLDCFEKLHRSIMFSEEINQWCVWKNGAPNYFKTFRSAIDAAMSTNTAKEQA